MLKMKSFIMFLVLHFWVLAWESPIQSYDFVNVLSVNHNALNFEAYNHTFHVILKPYEEYQKFKMSLHLDSGLEDIVDNNSLNSNVYNGIVHMDGIVLEETWARIVIQDEFKLKIDGVISTPFGLLHLQQIEHYRISKRNFDIEIASPFSRSKKHLTSKLILIYEGPSQQPFLRTLPQETHKLAKRDTQVTACGTEQKESIFSKVGQESINCPVKRKVLYMGVAGDCSYVSAKGGVANALQSIISNIVTSSAIFERTFNVQLALTKVVLKEKCDSSDTINAWNRDCRDRNYLLRDRLSDFSRWRGTVSNDGLGLWHLMTNCNSPPIVGVSWQSTICATESTTQLGDDVVEYVSGTGVSSIVPIEWKVVVHEIGHNFGAQHDCSTSTCATNSNCTPCEDECDCKGVYIMNPLDSFSSDRFSPGSTKRICSNIARDGQCLVDYDRVVTPKIIKPNVCGNGIKEQGEDCDCGSALACSKNPCCDGSTCKYKGNAVCDPNHESCCEKECKFSTHDTLCYHSMGVCDYDAYCSGVSSKCDRKPFVADGMTCSQNGTTAQCASGLCTTRDLQCKLKASLTFEGTKSACAAYANNCELNCVTTEGVCRNIRGHFLDGTTCGGSGRCKDGTCQGSTIWSLFILYVNLFPNIAVGILLSWIFVFVLMAWYCRRRQHRRIRIDRLDSEESLGNEVNMQKPLEVHSSVTAKTSKMVLQDSLGDVVTVQTDLEIHRTTTTKTIKIELDESIAEEVIIHNALEVHTTVRTKSSKMGLKDSIADAVGIQKDLEKCTTTLEKESNVSVEYTSVEDSITNQLITTEQNLTVETTDDNIVVSLEKSKENPIISVKSTHISNDHSKMVP
ncbi:Metallo-peptidase family M12-domain-containing protein [Globomyces pollinis-pini]|nr:Metallo-peptidase family M12-domain-containing protein [Globomyces pollinis-pini]